jgi:DNA-binding LytR/AlgR family response regulator
MFKVAICDNDYKELAHVRRCVQAYFDARPEIEGAVTEFSDSESLRACMGGDGAPFDCYVLDVMMPGLNGIQLGQLIQRDTVDRIPLIYITSSEEFALQAFGVRALQYLVKPIDAHQMEAALDEAHAIWARREARSIRVKTKEGISILPLDEIVYVENVARAARYVLYDGTVVEGVTNRGTFEEGVGTLAEEEAFIHPHKSFFVNMRYVQAVNADGVVMDGRITLPISRRNATDTRKRYLRYLARGGED